MTELTLYNGVKIPQVGLGVFRAENGKETSQAVKWALEAGYRHIDTATVYKNEESVGVGIKESGVKREDIFLTTKVWNTDIRQGRTREAFEESLRLLGTDYVDLYLIHWPVEGREAAWRVLEDEYRKGRIRAIGVSNFHRHHLEELDQVAEIAPMVDQIEAHPYFSNQELIDYCHSRKMAVEVWSPLGGGRVDLLGDETLLKLADKYQKTPAQIVIRWDIQRGVVVLPKSVHEERIRSNLDVFDFELTAEDMALIHSMNRNKRVGSDPDNFKF